MKTDSQIRRTRIESPGRRGARALAILLALALAHSALATTPALGAAHASASPDTRAAAELLVLLQSLGVDSSVRPGSNLPFPLFEPIRPPMLLARADETPGEGWPKSVPLMTGKGDLTEDLEGRFESEWRRLTYPTGTIPKGDWRGAAMKHVERFVREEPPEGIVTFRNVPGVDAVVPPGVNWTEMGPKPLDGTGTTNNAYQYGIVSGRVNAVAFQPGSATTAYFGASVGGLWKTTNCCSSATTWTPLWDAATFPAQSVGAIAIDSANTNVVYVGTGDSQVPAYDMYGNGVYKSTDAGTTWTQYGAGVMSPYSTPGAPGTTCCDPAPDQDIKTIVIDPNNHNTILAGASYGLFISYDAGVTWTEYDVVNRNSATYNTSAQRVTSILVDGGTNPSTMYVALGYPYSSTRRPNLIGGANGVYKATVPSSGPPTFTLMASGWPAGTGNGTVTSNVGRIELAWDATRTHIYAHVSDYANVGQTLGIWHSSNGGAAWNLLTGTTETSWTTCGTGGNETDQAWYDLTMAVDPLNDKTIYTGRTNLWKATVNAGYTSVTLTDLSGVYSTTCTGVYGTLHPDQHAFDFQPGSNPTRFLVGNDGGIYFGTGAAGGFTQLNAGVSTNQFYAGQLGDDYANTSGTNTQYAFGGMQDNGSASWDSAQTNLQWIGRSVGGDGFFAAFDPIAGTRTAGRWITEYANGVLSCSGTGAQNAFSACSPGYNAAEREDWSTPFILDQWNCTNATCGNLVLGSTTVWCSVNAGGAWTRTTAAATDLTKGTPGTIIAINVAHSAPGSVIVGTSDGNVQWSRNVFTGANCTAAAANTAAFACTRNNAATWVNLTGSNAVLPNRSIPGVAFDPNSNIKFYAAVSGFNTNTPATPGHIFMGTCAANPCTTANVTWTDKTGNLPDIPFESVQVNPASVNQVFAGSYLGFYYTNDITASPVIWNRFQTGMPNTRVRYLAVDRGVTATPKTSTTLGAFTFGRGMYVAQINMPACTPPAVPTGVAAAATAPNQITVTWNTVAGAASYRVYRSSGLCPGGAFALLGTVTAPTTSYQDNSVVGGLSYSYKVTAFSSCESSQSACAGATATGVCSAAPTFGGLGSAAAVSGGTCSVNLTWTAGSSNCGASVTYSVYRSTVSGFTPAAANRITMGLSGTTYTDSAGLSPSTTYYYVVRAVDTSTGTEDSNTVGSAVGTTLGASCGSGAPDVQAFTVTSTGNAGATTGQNLLEWWNPASGPAGMTITINFRTDQFPTGPADPSATTILTGRAVTPGAVDTFTHAGRTNGTTCYYALWVRN